MVDNEQRGKKMDEKFQNEKAIKKEAKRYSKMIAIVKTEEKQAALSLVERLAFIGVQLRELEEHISRHGVTEVYQNGANQSGVKKSPQAELYPVLARVHSQLTRQLASMAGHRTDDDDELEEFK